MKPIALVIVVAAIAGHGALLWFRPLDETALWIGFGLEAGLVAMFLLWSFVVTKASVTDASFAYAQQLFNHCETTTAATKPRSSKKLPTDNAS